MAAGSAWPVRAMRGVSTVPPSPMKWLYWVSTASGWKLAATNTGPRRNCWLGFSAKNACFFASQCRLRGPRLSPAISASISCRLAHTRRRRGWSPSLRRVSRRPSAGWLGRVKTSISSVKWPRRARYCTLPSWNSVCSSSLPFWSAPPSRRSGRRSRGSSLSMSQKYQAWYFWDIDKDEPLLRLPLRLEGGADQKGSEELQTEFQLGSVQYRARRGHFTLEMDVFTLPSQPAEGRRLTLRNDGDQPLRLRVCASLQLILAEIAGDSRGPLNLHWDAKKQAFFAENPSQQFRRGPVFVAASFQPEAVETQYSHFIGEGGTVETPRMARTGQADPAAMDIGYRVAALTSVVVIPPGQSIQLGLILGQAGSLQQAGDIIDKLRSTDALHKALIRTHAWWHDFLGGLRVTTRDPGFDRMVNDWLPYQLVTARLWGRSGPFQRSGAYGFRDQLQDVIPLAATHPAICRQQILLHAKQQFLEGDTLQWWHTTWDGQTGIGARNHASDIMLWLPYVALHYVKVSGDDEIWKESVHFIEGKPIPARAEGIVFVPLRSREKASLYAHCKLAIDRVLARLGEHGLPLTGTGGWDDGLDAVGHHGKGESVWLGFFLYSVLLDFAPVAAAQEDHATSERLRSCAAALKDALDQQWREQRYVRAITDNGEELIFPDALMSSWPILSGAVDAAHGEKALSHGLSALERDAIVLLLPPPFTDDAQPRPGRITQYPPGVRENGAQYSHGSSWLVDAALRLADMLEQQGNPAAAQHWRTRAGTLWHKISPLTHTAPERWLNYGLEPHQIGRA